MYIWVSFLVDIEILSEKFSYFYLGTLQNVSLYIY